MTNLIDRIEALDGPDREVDAEIAVASGDYRRDATRSSWLIEVATGHAVGGWPAYTSSVDAALTLVPSELMGNYTFEGDCVGRNGEIVQAATFFDDDSNRFDSHANTMPLAICAAALKARMGEG